MGRKSIYNILMYSHDTYGLGHIRRTMAIASHLRDEYTNILILTGSPIVGSFPLPDQIDFVRIPGMIKKTNDEYVPLSIRINPTHALDIRKNIIKATAKAFQPQLFIVDKEPLGLKQEILPTLKWMKRCLPETRTILGLRDIMDDSKVVRKDWRERGVYEVMDKLYNEIWVYGVQEFYDPIKEYGIPESISDKMTFTGYITRAIPDSEAVRRARKKIISTKNGEKLVVVTAGGGGDGYAMMSAYLKMLEEKPNGVPFYSILVTGPFMPRHERDDLTERARKRGVKTLHFHRRMEEMLGAADLVVSMGGYNTVCEILSQGTNSLIIPRETPRREQLIRAQVLKSQNMADYIPWNAVNGQSLFQKITEILENPDACRCNIRQFKMTGLDVMSKRLESFRDQE
ncbi:MAG: glycosyltransferase [Pseudomonadota bacterium]